MKKNQYIAPELLVIQLNQKVGILLEGSDPYNSKALLGTGDGNTGQKGITSGDVKGSTSYDVWDDDWSKN